MFREYYFTAKDSLDNRHPLHKHYYRVPLSHDRPLNQWNSGWCDKLRFWMPLQQWAATYPKKGIITAHWPTHDVPMPCILIPGMIFVNRVHQRIICTISFFHNDMCPSLLEDIRDNDITPLSFKTMHKIWQRWHQQMKASCQTSSGQALKKPFRPNVFLIGE